jgi:hypothetical protein
VHGEHSALGDAPMTDVFNYAFGQAGLDFVTLTDYVTNSAWGEVGRYQPSHKGKLIARSSEIITYRGHTNNQVSGTYVDYRTGPVYLRADSGAVSMSRGPVDPRELFRRIHAAGGWTQVNHPTIFPSDQPGNANFCRGCPWDYSDAETDWKQVDAFEVNTGPAAFGTTPNPFTATAIGEWDALRKRGFPLTGVAVSDSHHAGEVESSTQAPIGNGRTVVYADELSEDGVRRAVQAGHAYVKNFPDSPAIGLKGQRGRRIAIMGDALPGDKAVLAATVTGATGDGWKMSFVQDGEVIETVPVQTKRFEHVIEAREHGEFRIQVRARRHRPLGVEPDRRGRQATGDPGRRPGRWKGGQPAVERAERQAARYPRHGGPGRALERRRGARRREGEERGRERHHRLARARDVQAPRAQARTLPGDRNGCEVALCAGDIPRALRAGQPRSLAQQEHRTPSQASKSSLASRLTGRGGDRS